MSETLWTAREAEQATGSNSRGNWQAARVAIDSRTIQPGDLFVAIKGERFDGHAFAGEALKQGAAAVMVEEGARVDVPGEKALRVKDTQAALEALARAARARTSARIVGLTGSVGKTSVKEMLRLSLSAHGETFASHGNFNNHIGTPLNLANMPKSVQFAVFEMGMNHAGEISALTKLVKPEVAVITNVEAVHLEFFESVEAIADAKAEIFEGLMAEGTAILNRDNAQYARCRAHAERLGVKNIITFGAHARADIRLRSSRVNAEGMEVEAQADGQELSYTLAARGEHWALASLIPLAVAEALKLNMKNTVQAIASFEEIKGRGDVSPIALAGGDAWLVDDSYNASPASMRAAFARVKLLAGANPKVARRVAVLGEMRELGESAPQLHAELAEPLIAAGFDLVFASGRLMKYLYDALPPAMRGGFADDAQALLPKLLEQLEPGDMVLAKGSHGSKTYEIAEALKHLHANTDRMHAL